MYFDGEIPTPDAETRYKEAARLFKIDIDTRRAMYIHPARALLPAGPGGARQPGRSRALVATRGYYQQRR